MELGAQGHLRRSVRRHPLRRRRALQWERRFGQMPHPLGALQVGVEAGEVLAGAGAARLEEAGAAEGATLS